MTTKTANYNFNLIDFDKIPWGDEDHNNWHVVDALLARFLAISNIKGVWENALAVTLGERYIDSDLDTIYEVLVSHTTPSTGTFSASRSAVSSNWQSVTVDATNKGFYAKDTAYNPNDFVVDDGRYGIVQNIYTSDNIQATVTLSYDADVTAGNILTLIDASSLIAATHSTNTVSTGGTPTATYNAATATFDFGLVTGATGATGAAGSDGSDYTADAELNAIAGLTSAAGKMIEFTGSGAAQVITVTTAGKALIDDANASAQRTTLGLAIGSDVQAFDADTLKADTSDTLSGGYDYTADADGTKTTGTYTPTYAGGNVKTVINGGAHTIAPQSGNGVILVQYTNNGSAGTLTTSGFDKVSGDSLTTTDGNDFLCQLTVVGAFSNLHVTDVS